MAGALPVTAATSTTVTVKVAGKCIAPAEVGTNYCGFRGTLDGLGVDGADIVWEVTLFFDDLWRIQFQAFTETSAAECQYPILVSGSYSVPRHKPVRFVASRGFDLNITPVDYPRVTLRVDEVRVDWQHPNCG
jgi:hypothetical protein